MASKKKIKTHSSKDTARRKSKKKAVIPQTTAPRPTVDPQSSSAGLRVRMYRVGFGDFFLLSVPTEAGAYKHILIDCGVHAKDLGTIADAVSEMAEACNYELSLVIVTHRHADHISGFGTCRDIFKK